MIIKRIFIVPLLGVALVVPQNLFGQKQGSNLQKAVRSETKSQNSFSSNPKSKIGGGGKFEKQSSSPGPSGSKPSSGAVKSTPNPVKSGGAAKPGPGANKPAPSPVKPGAAPVRPGAGPVRPGGAAKPGPVKPAGPKHGTPGPKGPSPHRVEPRGHVPRFTAGNPFRPHVHRPHYHYKGPHYRPPRPWGGYWTVPPVNIYRPKFYAPAPPPPRTVVVYNVPVLSTILGTAFGTFIDTSLNQIYNSGYNILGYDNNIVYLSNVNQLGYEWPEVSAYYTDGLLSDVQFQNWTSNPSNYLFDRVYSQLQSTYGSPLEYDTVDGIVTVNWWAGENTGYVTLQYGPGLSESGSTYYYTTLTYSSI